jgi:hypothetical protein
MGKPFHILKTFIPPRPNVMFMLETFFRRIFNFSPFKKPLLSIRCQSQWCSFYTLKPTAVKCVKSAAFFFGAEKKSSFSVILDENSVNFEVIYARA